MAAKLLKNRQHHWLEMDRIQIRVILEVLSVVVVIIALAIVVMRAVVVHVVLNARVIKQMPVLRDAAQAIVAVGVIQIALISVLTVAPVVIHHALAVVWLIHHVMEVIAQGVVMFVHLLLTVLPVDKSDAPIAVVIVH